MGQSMIDERQGMLFDPDNVARQLIQKNQSAPTISAGELVDLFKQSVLKVPIYQRDAGIWSREKKRSYIYRLFSDNRGPKSIITMYYTEDSPSVLWIMDGLQRLTTIIEFIDNPSLYMEVGGENAITMARMYQVGIEVCKCKDHVEAMLFFQQLNMGTALTPYEYHKGILRAYYEQLKSFYAYLDRLCSFVGLKKVERREKQHHQYRSMNGVLYRYLATDSRLNSLSISQKPVSDPKQSTKNEVEHRLLRAINEKGLSRKSLADEITQLVSDLELDTATIRDVWSDGRPDGHNIRVPESLYIWLWSVSVWRRIEKKSDEQWRSFLVRLRSCYGGLRIDADKVVTGDGSQFSLIDSEGKTLNKVTINVNDLGKLRVLCQILQSDFITAQPETSKRKQQPLLAVQGADMRHAESFVDNGDGEVWYGPSSGNRAKGAKDDPPPYKQESNNAQTQ